MHQPALSLQLVPTLTAQRTHASAATLWLMINNNPISWHVSCLSSLVTWLYITLLHLVPQYGRTIFLLGTLSGERMLGRWAARWSRTASTLPCGCSVWRALRRAGPRLVKLVMQHGMVDGASAMGTMIFRCSYESSLRKPAGIPDNG